MEKFTTLYQMRNIENLSTNERYGWLEFTGPGYAVINNYDVPSLWPKNYTIADLLQHASETAKQPIDRGIFKNYELLEVEIKLPAMTGERR